MLYNTKFVVQLTFITLLFVVLHIVNINSTEGAGSDIKIYRGLSAVGHQYLKHLVLIYTPKTRKPTCGGSILKPKVILTAAHCVSENGSKSLIEEFVSKAHVCAGNPEIVCNSTTRQISEVQDAFVHKKYNRSTGANDIAIIFLEKALAEDGKTVQRINLANRKPSIGTTCTAIGWGQIKCRDAKIQHPKEAQYTLQTRVSAKYCNKWFNFLSTHLCVADKNKTSRPCKGDSGTPLICDGRAAGILSCGRYNRSRRLRHSIYTNVFSYRKWINKIIDKLPSASVRNRAGDFCIIFVMALFANFHYSYYL